MTVLFLLALYPMGVYNKNEPEKEESVIWMKRTVVIKQNNVRKKNIKVLLTG